MKERIDENTPMKISRLFLFPYLFFSRRLSVGNTSVIDIACGTALFQRHVLFMRFDEVILADSQPVSPEIRKLDITNIDLPDKSVDVAFSFETIEHTYEHTKVICELTRIARKHVVIGSVNIDGPCEIDGLEIYVGERNPYHVKELGIKDFCELYPNMELFHSTFKDGKFTMSSGLSKKGICNYGVVNL